MPVVEAPYNLAKGGAVPGMPQSVALAVDFYGASHESIARIWGRHQVAAKLSMVAWDVFGVLGLALPGSEGWLHEEFHRAVLGRRGIDGFNTVYDFRLVSPALYVSRVSDDDLIRFKRDHPAEQVRSSSAGLEGQYVFTDRLERDRFFGRASWWSLPMLVLSKASVAGYVWSAQSHRVDESLDRNNYTERADIMARDFTGHDVTAWVYDLHRPDEPYTERGAHPYGIGIDRYIKRSDLTAAELEYLRRQGRLNLWNLADSSLAFPSGIEVRNPMNDRKMRVGARVGHVLTPFGYSLDVVVMARQGNAGLALTYHTYVNHERHLPGVDVELVDVELGRTIRIHPRIALWLQPDRLRFDAEKGRLGGLAGCRVEQQWTRRVDGYVDLQIKSAGWVAGSEYLDRQVSALFGLVVRIR